VRTSAAGIIAAVFLHSGNDASVENLFANSVDNFLSTSEVSLA